MFLFSGGRIVDDSGTHRLVQRTLKDLTLVTDEEVVPAQGSGFSVRVLALMLRSGLAVTVRLKSAGNNLSAALALGANDDLVLPFNPAGWFQTNDNEALNTSQSVAVATGAQVIWIQVPSTV